MASPCFLFPQPIMPPMWFGPYFHPQLHFIPLFSLLTASQPESLPIKKPSSHFLTALASALMPQIFCFAFFFWWFGSQLKCHFFRCLSWSPNINLNPHTFYPLPYCFSSFIAHITIWYFPFLFVVQLSQVENIIHENRRLVCYVNHCSHSS